MFSVALLEPSRRRRRYNRCRPPARLRISSRPVDGFGPGRLEQPFAPVAGVDIASQHIRRFGEDGGGVVGEKHLHFSAFLPNQGGVIFHIVHAGKGMFTVAEQLPVFFLGEYVGPGIDPFLVQFIRVKKMIAHFIGGIGQHKGDFIRAPGDAPQADGETVPAQDGEDHADVSRLEIWNGYPWR